MTEDTDVVELPRFSRRLGVLDEMGADDAPTGSASIGVLAPFGGVLEYRIERGRAPRTDLSYLTLGSIVADALAPGVAPSAADAASARTTPSTATGSGQAREDGDGPPAPEPTVGEVVRRATPTAPDEEDEPSGSDRDADGPADGPSAGLDGTTSPGNAESTSSGDAGSTTSGKGDTTSAEDAAGLLDGEPLGEPRGATRTHLDLGPDSGRSTSAAPGTDRGPSTRRRPAGDTPPTAESWPPDVTPAEPVTGRSSGAAPGRAAPDRGAGTPRMTLVGGDDGAGSATGRSASGPDVDVGRTAAATGPGRRTGTDPGNGPRLTVRRTGSGVDDDRPGDGPAGGRGQQSSPRRASGESMDDAVPSHVGLDVDDPRLAAVSEAAGDPESRLVERLYRSLRRKEAVERHRRGG